MNAEHSPIGWNDAQWNKVNKAITDEFTRASVAGAILPCYGPLPDNLESVREQRLQGPPSQSIVTVDDDDTFKLWTLSVFVHLKHEQIRDEELGSALLAFRRAASLLATTEDHIVFRGKPDPNDNRLLSEVVRKPGSGNKGLVHHNVNTVQAERKGKGVPTDLVEKVVEAIGILEKQGYPGPYACALDNNCFKDLHTPAASMVMPADRLLPILRGPLVRCAQLPDDRAVVISSAGEPIDLVVATAPKAQFLQINEEAKYVFRVYERFVLRVKDEHALVVIVRGS